MTTVLSDIPLVDLAAGEIAVRQQLSNACRNWGFFQVANHGIPASLADDALLVSAEFFAQALAAKQALSRSYDNPWGYYDRELTKNQRDRKEIFDFSPREAAPWPRQLPRFRTVLDAWTTACHQLALRLLQLVCQGLGQNANALLPHFNPDHSSFTRLNHYPVDDILVDDADAPVAGPLGISHHSDAGALTVLLQDAVAGLQVLHEEQWHDVIPEPNTLTINIGDMMQVWSNDRYGAPLHRVRASESRDRYSIAYFLNPAYDTVVRPPVEAPGAARYRPFSWQEFRGLRARGDFDNYGEEVQISHYLQHP